MRLRVLRSLARLLPVFAAVLTLWGGAGGDWSRPAVRGASPEVTFGYADRDDATLGVMPPIAAPLALARVGPPSHPVRETDVRRARATGVPLPVWGRTAGDGQEPRVDDGAPALPRVRLLAWAARPDAARAPPRA